MKVCVEIILSYFLLLNIVAVQGTGKVQINYYKYDTKGVDYYGDSCDWYSRNCEIYLYLKYRECYSSLSSCSSYNSYYYYAGDNAKILNIIRTYSTSNTFSGRVQTQVDTYDDDGGWSNDDGLVTYTLSLTFRYASTSWSTYRSTFLGTGAYFEWKYRFYCDSYYYSNLCSIYCKARDDSSGHYTCGSSGTKNCSSGWGGTDCKYDVNKCTDGSHTCNSYSEYCSNVGNGGGYTCECLTGYTKSGSYCVNINECSSGTDGCSHYCYDTYGSYTCGCSSGYYLSGKNCYDTNECTANTDGCHHTCYNTAGSYYCDCNSGYTLSSNGKTCNDVNECSSNTDNCAQICYNTVGSFTCDCNSGYTLNSGRYCFDINECLTNNGGCAHTCTNTYGSFTCSCNTGYYLSTDTTSCMDTNECSVSNGGCGHVCTNSVDSFTCSCFSGYYLSSNERSCYDINECTQSHGCDHSCQNSAGSYSCQCSTGYTLASDGRHCDDIDECSQSNCDNQCTNIVGSYICSCIDGYSLDVDGRTCIDVDECAEDATLCPSPKICINQLGSYECGCISGYQLLQSPERCEDINECTTGTDLCEQICTNLVGSYDCGCNTNYYLHNTYSCDIILFTVTIVSSQVTSSGADIYLSTQFIPSTASVSVTYQIHTLDVSFGNGNYEVAPPTSDYSPISFSNLKPYRYYRCYVTATGTFYSVDSGYLTIGLWKVIPVLRLKTSD